MFLYSLFRINRGGEGVGGERETLISGYIFPNKIESRLEKASRINRKPSPEMLCLFETSQRRVVTSFLKLYLHPGKQSYL
jgi:hypothetical protein